MNVSILSVVSKLQLLLRYYYRNKQNPLKEPIHTIPSITCHTSQNNGTQTIHDLVAAACGLRVQTDTWFGYKRFLEHYASNSPNDFGTILFIKKLKYLNLSSHHFGSIVEQQFNLNIYEILSKVVLDKKNRQNTTSECVKLIEHVV